MGQDTRGAGNRGVMRRLAKKLGVKGRSRKSVPVYAKSGRRKTSRAPDFICIGAQKAGTSWLGGIVRQRPDTWNPGVKEVHFFDRSVDGRVPAEKARRVVALYEKNAKKNAEVIWPAGLAEQMRRDGMGIEEYLGMFSQAPRGKLSWEMTPAYSAMEATRVDEMLRQLPETKFIYILRDPVKRTESALRMQLEWIESKGGDQKALEDAARTWLKSNKVNRGNYADTIPLWDDRLAGTDRLLYLPFGMVKTDPAGLVRQVEDFLGLKPFGDYKGLDKPFHATRKIELPEFAAEKIRRQMEPHRAYLRERFGEVFASQT